jgi:hypothetical protein
MIFAIQQYSYYDNHIDTAICHAMLLLLLQQSSCKPLRFLIITNNTYTSYIVQHYLNKLMQLKYKTKITNAILGYHSIDK